MRHVLGISPCQQRKTAIRQNGMRPPVAAALHGPFENDRAQLPGAIDHRIAEVRHVHMAFRVLAHHRVFGLLNEVAEFSLIRGFDSRVGFRRRHRHAGRKVGGGVRETPVTRCAADGDETIGAGTQHFGDIANPAIGRDRDVEGPVAERCLQRVREMRIADQALDLRRNRIGIAAAPVQHGHRVATVQQTPNDMRPRRTRAADKKRLHLFFLSSFQTLVSINLIRWRWIGRHFLPMPHPALVEGCGPVLIIDRASTRSA